MDASMNEFGEEPGVEPEIVFLGISRKSYYLLEGDDHLNELLLSDGTFPRPILCLHFETILDVRIKLGESVSVGQLWAIHPEIVARLRNDEDLIEKDVT